MRIIVAFNQVKHPQALLANNQRLGMFDFCFDVA
jgi:hypothetical protein